MNIRSARHASSGEVLVLLTGKATDWSATGLSEAEIKSAQQAFGQERELLFFPGQRPGKVDGLLLLHTGIRSDSPADQELLRRLGADTAEWLNRNKVRGIFVDDASANPAVAFALVEGLTLANYQFRRYRSNGDGKYTLENVTIAPSALSPAAVQELEILVQATHHARDLVNEPLSFLTAVQLAKEFQKLGKEAGFRVSVLQHKKIEELGMGGLLAVNLGSPDPATFTIMEWKPARPRNKNPIVLVGKGVVYDTGGLTLKPTPNGMDFMKCDMAGGAAVGGALYAAARAKLPVHVIGLVPATDNRPGGNAYVPGDIIRMYSGKTVEVLNTDAEGRLLLADALHYAKQYKPELVIDLATLTGAAAAAIGPLGIVAMGTAAPETVEGLKHSGQAVHERLAEFPFWPEYGDEIKSEVADLKNVGGGFGGAITAGKFLEAFTDYPWMHLDIAGPAYLHAANAYRTRFGTGVGVRLLYHFLKHYPA
jgi:leucyl aminopeptidase